MANFILGPREIEPKETKGFEAIAPELVELYFDITAGYTAASPSFSSALF